VEPIDLGPFRLVEPIARGASGEVWRAIHRTERLPAAIKVLAGAQLREARQFRDEVRALAALDHPHVVTLLDAGTVDDGPAVAGRPAPGAPWLALEYASAGTVGQRAPTAWPEILELVQAVLDALAHAHARGLVHRDLKPANLLWCGERDPRPGLKLTDFGIALRFVDIAPDELPAGTPQYMAPEQLGGDLADVGPWTDLYSLGCLVWRLTTGALPYEGMKRAQLVRAHLTRPLPPWVPRGPVPAGLEDWLRALLAKRPQDRPQRAADAAAALALIDPSGRGQGARMWASVLSDDVELLDADEALLEDPTARLNRGAGPPAAVPDWREPPGRRPPELVGAGLGLLLLRDPPVVGRQAEQDLLWDELRVVAERGCARLVVLRGPAGSGRTRLLRWLCTRADEVGAARVVWSDGAVGGLAATVPQLLRVGDRSGAAREEWLREVLHEPELVGPALAFLDDTLPEGVRGGVGARLLGRTDRSTVLCLDDCDRAPADLSVVAELLAGRGPILVAVAVDDHEADSAFERGLAALGGVVLPVGPLSGSAARDLLSSLVRLDDALAAELEERSAGSPAFLMDVLGDWVLRGWLTPGPRGYRLRDDVAGSAFPEAGAAAARRLRQVLAAVTPAAAWDLTMAAALGPVVDERLWHGACDDPDGAGLGWAPDGVARRASLVEQLSRQRVLTATERGFSLHGPFREAVIASARERGRWGRVCRTAADVLARSGGADPAQRGRLLLEARDPEAALPLLLDAADAAVEVSARRALAVWVDAERALRLGGAATAPAAAQVSLSRARIDLALGDPVAARSHLPPPPADPALRFRVGLVELDLLLATGELAAAAALARALRNGTRDLVVIGRLLLAESEAVERSDPLASLSRLEEARDAWNRAGVTGEAMAPLTLRQGRRCRQRGDLLRARTLFERVLDEVGPRGDPRLRVLAGAALAEVLARSGDAARGGVTARRAIAAGDSGGVPTVEARLASGICRVVAADGPGAVAELDEALRTARRTGRSDLLLQAHAALACAHAASREWGAVHDHLREVERGGVAHDPVLSELLRDLVRSARTGGYPQLKARAQALLAG
jgi:hypothetical protein